MPARLQTRTPQQSHRDRALHGINRAGEIGDDVSPAVLRRDKSIDDGTASLHPGERTDLVARHQTAVTGDVSGKDRGEFALYRMDRQAWLLLIRV